MVRPNFNLHEVTFAIREIKYPHTGIRRIADAHNYILQSWNIRDKLMVILNVLNSPLGIIGAGIYFAPH